MTLDHLKNFLQNDLKVSLTEFNKAKQKEGKVNSALCSWFKKEILKSEENKAPAHASKKHSKTPSGHEEKKPQDPPSKEGPNHEHGVLPGEVEEEPAMLAKILILQEDWGQKICSGEKTMELCKSRITSSNKPETIYLAVGKTIFARCEFLAPVQIKTEKEFQKLQPSHCWNKPELPYAFPFVGHYLTNVQRLKPLEFCRLQGTVGRALYRPVGWKGDAEGEKKEETEEKAEGEKKEKKGSSSKDKAAAKGKAKKQQKKQSFSIKTLPTNALEETEVKTVEAEKHLQPSKSRFDAKASFLERKSKKPAVDISGGVLSHLNNWAFSREPALTGAYLLGKRGWPASVTGLHVPPRDMQEKFEEWEVVWPLDGWKEMKWHRETGGGKEEDAGGKEQDEEGKEKDQEGKEKHEEDKEKDEGGLELVGAVLVLPEGEKEDSKQLDLLEKYRKSFDKSFGSNHSLIMLLTGKDKLSLCYHFADDKYQQLHMEVHWVGPKSIYQARVVDKDLNVNHQIHQAGLKRALLENSKPLKKRKDLQEERNAARRQPSREAGGLGEESLKQLCEDLQDVANFLVENLVQFGNQAAAEKYEACLQKHPLARAEMRKLSLETPETVQQAGETLAKVLELKGVVERRMMKRRYNETHTYDGNKCLGFYLEFPHDW